MMGSTARISDDYSAQTEQGFAIEMCREPRRSAADMEGLYFIWTLGEDGEVDGISWDYIAMGE